MEPQKRTIYIVDCKRTAIAAANKSFKNLSCAQLASSVIDGVMSNKSIKKEDIAEVILGNTVSAGTGQNLARKAILLSSLPNNVPGYVVNNVCGSGLQAVILGGQKISAEDVDFVIAGASESATHNPKLIISQESEAVDSLITDGLFCGLADKHMGQICEELAKEHNISREEQDKYALGSHKKACAARASGKFDSEIIVVDNGAADISQDERPREKTSLEKLARLPAAFAENGTVTAGNASAPSDGACAFLLASEDAVSKNNLQPLAKIIGYVSLGVDAAKVFSDGAIAVEQCLKKCGLKMKDIDLFEVVEAFAAQAVYTQKSLSIPEDKLNVWGGDVALGHPLSIASARALVTLVHALIDNKKKTGLLYVAFGAGGAISMIVEIV